jgi:hypothetical protein
VSASARLRSAVAANCAAHQRNISAGRTGLGPHYVAHYVAREAARLTPGFRQGRNAIGPDTFLCGLEVEWVKTMGPQNSARRPHFFYCIIDGTPGLHPQTYRLETKIKASHLIQVNSSSLLERKMKGINYCFHCNMKCTAHTEGN